ncbi:MAG: HAD family phosphatase [Candidatus Levybacteria bacterium]|nr:HAD family phosphatase [Candidatus Levybacteria bacterium]
MIIKTVIFDLDGVLVDATEWHFEALNDALQLFGYEINKQDHETVYNGLPTTEKLKLLTKRKGFPIGLHEVVKRLKRKYTDQFVEQYCRPSYEKQIMLTHLKSRGIKLAVCSNAQKYSVLNMLKKSQIDHFFDLIIGNDEGYKPKPHSEIYLAAFKKLKVKPEEVIIVEDAPHGVKAAKDSGANTIEVAGYEHVNLTIFNKFYETK